MLLRELFAKLGLDVDAQSFAKGQLLVEGVKAGLGKLVDKAVEAAQQFVENIQATAEYAEEIDGLGQSTGLGTESLQKLGKAAAAEGIGIQELGQSITVLSRTMVAAKNGSEEVNKAFKKAGVSIKDAAGNLRPAEDVFIDMADHFSKTPDGAEKTALAMQLLGKSGTGMIQVLNNGREELERYMQATVMSPEQIAAGKEVIQTQRQLAAQTKSLWRGAVAPLLPAINDLLKQYLAWKKANAEVMKQRIQQFLQVGIKLVRGLATAFTTALAVIKFFRDNWKAVAAIGVAGALGWAAANASLIASFIVVQAKGVWAAARVAGAWLIANAPFIALAALIAGILLVFDDVRTYQEGGRSLYGRFKAEIDNWLKPSGTDPWWLTAIKDLVRWMQEALGLADKLGLASDKTPAGIEARRKQREGSDLSRQYQVAKEGPLGTFGALLTAPTNWINDKLLGGRSPEAQARDERALRAREMGAGLWDAMKAGFGYGPYAAPTAPPASNVTTTGPVSIVVHGAPGQSEERIGEIVVEKLGEHGVVTRTDLEAAAAATGG